MIRQAPLPKRMRALQKDSRGYPTPFIILRDSTGKPCFTINDSLRVVRCLVEKRCPICGYRLDKTIWFVGGPMSALHPNGAYLDTGMHYECMEYALQVCPYLASPNYLGRLDAKTVDLSKIPFRVFIDNTMMPERPELFIAIATRSFTYEDIYVRPDRPYAGIEYWRNGKRISVTEARELVPDGLKEMVLK